MFLALHFSKAYQYIYFFNPFISKGIRSSNFKLCKYDSSLRLFFRRSAQEVIRLSQSCETERFSADVYLQQKKACSTLDRLENRKLWNPPHSNDYSGRNLVWSQPAGFTPEDLLGEVGETRPFAQHEIT